MDKVTPGQDVASSRAVAPPDVHAIAEVRIETALERWPDVERFYTDVLGLPPWPAREQIPGGWGCGDSRCGLYLQFRHDPHVDPMRRRLTLVVASLDELEKRLAEHAWAYRRYRGLGYTDQWIVLADPIGHLIEIRQSQNLM